jgi:arabinose-5-phosphate isomerase
MTIHLENGRASEDAVNMGREVLEIEAAAIFAIAKRLDARFAEAVELLERRSGKVVTTGVGKSGIASRKLAATLTSTGCPAVYMHPTEAMHGDLGIVLPGDIVIAMSNGGESEELVALLPMLTGRDVRIIAIVGNPASTLARAATVTIDASIEREACPLNLAPTTSVVAALAVGDALAMTLQKRRGFSPDDYAANHPGGRLGRRLTIRVRDLMGMGSDVPLVHPGTMIMDILTEITAKGWGAACVTDSGGRLMGFITDFDLRKCWQEHGAAGFSKTADEIMVTSPAVLLSPDQLAFEALQMMEDRPRPVSVAPVVDSDGRCCGIVRVHDIVRARI